MPDAPQLAILPHERVLVVERAVEERLRDGVRDALLIRRRGMQARELHLRLEALRQSSGVRGCGGTPCRPHADRSRAEPSAP